MLLAAFCISIIFGLACFLIIGSVLAIFIFSSKLVTNDFKLNYWLDTFQMWLAIAIAQPIYYGLIWYNYTGTEIPANGSDLAIVISSFVLGMVWGIAFTHHIAYFIKK